MKRRKRLSDLDVLREAYATGALSIGSFEAGVAVVLQREESPFKPRRLPTPSEAAANWSRAAAAKADNYSRGVNDFWHEVA